MAFVCNRCHRDIETAGLFCPFCGAPAPQPDAEPNDPYIGKTIAEKFFVNALLGKGGMGQVYKATHVQLDRLVALKMLNRSLLSDPSMVQRFHREARAASKLNHPNCINILDFGETEDGALFIAMEYLPGRSLAKLLTDEFPLGELRVVRIVGQILGALAEAHGAGIIHRDLKLSNVMVEARRDEPDFVKVLDFGIAKLSEAGSSHLTGTGIVCGTPGYMSPEQARGLELDARSDLYAVGVIMYELPHRPAPVRVRDADGLRREAHDRDPGLAAHAPAGHRHLAVARRARHAHPREGPRRAPRERDGAARAALHVRSSCPRGPARAVARPRALLDDAHPGADRDAVERSGGARGPEVGPRPPPLRRTAPRRDDDDAGRRAAPFRRERQDARPCAAHARAPGGGKDAGTRAARARSPHPRAAYPDARREDARAPRGRAAHAATALRGAGRRRVRRGGRGDGSARRAVAEARGGLEQEGPGDGRRGRGGRAARNRGLRPPAQRPVRRGAAAAGGLGGRGERRGSS